jgi:hypothetical protein
MQVAQHINLAEKERYVKYRKQGLGNLWNKGKNICIFLQMINNTASETSNYSTNKCSFVKPVGTLPWMTNVFAV